VAALPAKGEALAGSFHIKNKVSKRRGFGTEGGVRLKNTSGEKYSGIFFKRVYLKKERARKGP